MRMCPTLDVPNKVRGGGSRSTFPVFSFHFLSLPLFYTDEIQFMFDLENVNSIVE